VRSYRLVTEFDVEDDVASAFDWYERERVGLGAEFLDELAATYNRILAVPTGYQILWEQVRHARLRRFPYSVYFVIEGELVIVFAVLHGRRDPELWQQRR
jgi:plasmid stabilization system protein ParE